ncbi:MAG: large subunit ribosomal protein L4 [Gammaproteobacteria bacterium]|jgi:large subunit ribosomal protein L4
MELALISPGGEQAGAKVEVADATFAVPYNETLVHQIVTAYMAGARAGTKAQKTRSDVRGGGAKPWRQKGSGRARAGTSRSPIWRGGGVTFAARPRNYDQKVNRKMYRGALRSIFSELIRQERMIVVESLPVSEPKTKAVSAMLTSMGLDDVLIITEGFDEALALSVRNLRWAAVVESSQVNPVSLIAYQQVLITSGALKFFEERLS